MPIQNMACVKSRLYVCELTKLRVRSHDEAQCVGEITKNLDPVCEITKSVTRFDSFYW
jgi:hypothetical protein